LWKTAQSVAQNIVDENSRHVCTYNH
jgi:hypothetical protein